MIQHTKISSKHHSHSTSRSRQEQPALSQLPAQSRIFVESYDLPQSYNTTYLTLLVRDPHWVHAYWEISSSSIEEMRNTLGAEFDRSAYTLRMYDVTNVNFNGHNANQWFDLDFAPHTNNWYVNIWCDNVSYCGEIGMRTPEGRFFAFARSNAVTTPRVSASDRSEMIWMDIKEHKAQPFVYTASRAQRIQKALANAKGFPKGKESGRKIYLTEDDIRAYYANLFPILKRLRGKRLKNMEFVGAKGKDLRSITGQGPFEDINIPGLSRTEHYRKYWRGNSADFAESGGASEQLASGASERQHKGRKFFFELWTELLVYGRTESDAQVKHGEKIIPLRPDGTFSLRFALPDGKIPLDFTATSKDKVETRRITTGVERFKTIYTP